MPSRRTTRTLGSWWRGCRQQSCCGGGATYHRPVLDRTARGGTTCAPVTAAESRPRSVKTITPPRCRWNPSALCLSSGNTAGLRNVYATPFYGAAATARNQNEKKNRVRCYVGVSTLRLPTRLRRVSLRRPTVYGVSASQTTDPSIHCLAFRDLSISSGR